jgi:hypothetical protein
MTDSETKPADCTCQYPTIKCRNGTGHAPECPAYKRLISAWSLTAAVRKYRKLPVVIEAVKWNGYNFAAVSALSENIFGPYRAHEGKVPSNVKGDGDHLEIKTLEGRMRADEGDWIIKGVASEVYPCKPDIFEKTYEQAL